MIARPPLAVPLFGLVSFAGLLTLVASGWTGLESLDTALSERLRGYAVDHAGMISVLRLATDIAATLPFLAAGAAATLLFAARRDHARAVFCAGVTVLVPVCWGLSQWLLSRPRPLDGFVLIAANGFPSGHTTNAAAAGLAMVLLAWPRQHGAGRVAVIGLAVAFVLFVAATRLILLTHWPADVLGGCLLALAVVPLVAMLARRADAAR